MTGWLATAAVSSAAALVAWIAFLFVRWAIIRRRYDHIPGPRTGPLGTLPEVRKHMHRLYDFDVDRFHKYGPTHKVTTPFWRASGMVRTIDPRNIEHVLKTNFRNYVKPDRLRRSMLELIGDGIFRLNHGFKGEYEMWHDQRKTMSNIFFRNNFEGFMQHVFVRHARVLCDVLRESAAAAAAATAAGGGTTGSGSSSAVPAPGVVDAQAAVCNFTMDSIAEIGFGVHFNALRRPMPVATSFDRAQELTFRRLLHPFYQIPVVGKLLYSEETEMEHKLKEIEEFSCRIIQERRGKMAAAGAATQTGSAGPGGAASGGGAGADAGGAKGRQGKKRRGAEVGQDCLSLFLDNSFTTARYTDKQLQNIVMGILMAGRDTTACTLSFSIAELMMHKDVARRLRAEMADKLAHTSLYDGDADVGMADLTQRNMPYLHGFVYEMLRLHPPVPFEIKFCVEKDVWPDGTVIPARSSVSFNIYAMGRDAARWEDPLAVRPERWAPDRKPPSAFEFPVFQAGPRICLGMNMAVLEAKIALAHLVPAFDFEPAAGCRLPPHYKVRLTQSIEGGLPVRVRVVQRPAGAAAAAVAGATASTTATPAS